MCVYCVFLCLCVYVKERERERDRERVTSVFTRQSHCHKVEDGVFFCVCMRVWFVCVWPMMLGVKECVAVCCSVLSANFVGYHEFLEKNLYLYCSFANETCK